MAEGVRFELTRPLGLPVFKTGAINRSATPPEYLRSQIHYSNTPLLQVQIARSTDGVLEYWSAENLIRQADMFM